MGFGHKAQNQWAGGLASRSPCKQPSVVSARSKAFAWGSAQDLFLFQCLLNALINNYNNLNSQDQDLGCCSPSVQANVSCGAPRQNLGGSLLIRHHHLTGPGLIRAKGGTGEVWWRPKVFQLSCLVPAWLPDPLQNQEGAKMPHVHLSTKLQCSISKMETEFGSASHNQMGKTWSLQTSSREVKKEK